MMVWHKVLAIEIAPKIWFEMKSRGLKIGGISVNLTY